MTAAPAFSNTVTVDFEGAGGGFGSIADYYNFGTDIPVNGTPSTGPYLGLHFGLDLAGIAGSEDVANAPGPGNTVMAVAGAGGDYAMTSVLCFNALSFAYSATNNTSVTVSFTGGSTQTYNLAATDSTCELTGPAFCVWSLATLDLGGRVATAVDFADTSGVAGFDNLSVNNVPLPAGVWLLVSALGGLGVLRRKRAA